MAAARKLKEERRVERGVEGGGWWEGLRKGRGIS